MEYLVYSKCLKEPIPLVDLSNNVEQNEVDVPLVYTQNSEPSHTYLETTEATTLVYKQEKHPILALKNNLLYDAILLPNIELELYIARRLSVNLDF